MPNYSKIFAGLTLAALITGFQSVSRATLIEPDNTKEGKPQGAVKKEGAADERKGKDLRAARPIRSMDEGIRSPQIQYDERLGKVIESFEKGNSYLETLETGLTEKREEAGGGRALNTNENIRAELAALHGPAPDASTAQKLLDLMRLITTNNSAIAQIAWTMQGNPPVADAPNYLGPLGNDTLNIGVNGKPALRIIPTAFTPNLVGGNEANITSGDVIGVVIAGGGDTFFPNQVHGDYGVVGGGLNNMAGGEFRYLKSPFATVGGGRNNSANRRYSTISGGTLNVADGLSSVVSGGQENNASEEFSSISGGAKNFAEGRYSSIGGGGKNRASGTGATIAGGEQNQASGRNAFIGSGSNNEAAGDYSTVPGGSFNTALGKHSLAAGHQAQARHDGSFVWSDSDKKVFQSTARDQFLIKADGNVGIDTESPKEKLTVAGNIAPANPSAHSLGTSEAPWKALYLDDTLHVEREWKVEQKGRTTLRLDTDGNLHVSGKIFSKGGHPFQAPDQPSHEEIDPNAAIRRSTSASEETAPVAAAPSPDSLTGRTVFGGAVQGTYDQLELAPKSITPFHLADNAVRSEHIANNSITLQDINRSDFAEAYVTRSGGKISGTIYLPEDGLAVGVNQLHVRDGKVGIGVSEPKEKLSVNGAVYAAGGIRFADGSLQQSASLPAAPEMTDAFRALVKETVENEIMPLVEERIAAQVIPGGAVAPAMGVQADPATSLSKKDLQTAMEAFRAELQRALTEQAQSLKPVDRRLTVDEERALIRKAVSEMKQTMERMVSHLDPPPVTHTNVVVQELSPEAVTALKNDILAAVTSQQPKAPEHKGLTRQEIDIITSEFIGTIDQRIKEYHPNQVIQQFTTNITQVIRETLPPEAAEHLAQSIQLAIEQRLPELVPAPVIIQTNLTRIIRETLADETRLAFITEVRSQVLAEVARQEPQVVTQLVEKPLAPEKIAALRAELAEELSQSLAAQIETLVKAAQPVVNPAVTGPPEAPEISREDLEARIQQMEKRMQDTLAEKIDALSRAQSNTTTVVQQGLSNKERTQLMAQIRKDLDQKIAMMKPTSVTTVVREEITQDEKIELVEDLLKQTDERILERIKAVTVTNVVIQAYTNTIIHAYTNTIVQAYTNVIVQAHTNTILRSVTNVIVQAHTNILRQTLPPEEREAMKQALRGELEQLLVTLVKPPVIQQTVITNTIVQDITREKQEAILNDAREEMQRLIAAIKLPEPMVQHTSVTNIIEREWTEAQKEALMKVLYAQVTEALPSMVKAPVVTHTYVTNIVRETLSAADRETLLADAQRRTLAALPPPPAIESKTPGLNNMTTTPSASIAGGQENVAAGAYSTVPGGRDNLAKGAYSFAAGRRAKAVHDGAMVWADAQDQDFVSSADNQFKLRAGGGTRIQSGPSSESGVTLHAGSHAWSTAAAASTKKDVARADVTDVLDRLAQLPIYSYRLKDQTSGAVHLGPHAEEFYAAFGLGENGATMNSADADAVALASVQALHQMFLAKLIESERNKLEIQRMRSELDNMNAFIKQLRQVLEAQAATP